MKKKRDDTWYKNKTWNGDIDSRFERQLRYTRNELHKASYLQVQGCMLLDNAAANIQEVGLVLLDRLFEDFPRAFDQRLMAQEKLGDYFYAKKEFNKAASFYETVTLYCQQQQSRTHTSGKTDLKWAATLLQLQQQAGLEKAAQLVAGYPEKLLQTPAQQFYHAELGAVISASLGQSSLAGSYAARAIAAGKLMKPVMSLEKLAPMVALAKQPS